MKAAVFYEPEQIQLEDVPDPQAGDDEVVVRVHACGFCGSDIEYYYGKSPLGTPDGKGPLVLGHELCGEVVEAGRLAASYGLAEGDRVSVNPVQSCNACDMCRAGKVAFCPNMSVLGVTTNGGFAEYAKTKIAHAYKIPDSLTDEQGAFVEMLSSAVYAVRRADVDPGNFAVVYGPGPVGLSMVQLLKNEGARVALVGTRDYRLGVGKSLGADHVWNTRDESSPYWVADLAEAIQEANDGRLADRALVATANVNANQQAIPNDAVSVSLLSNLTQDKTIRFSWLYPLQWPTTIRLLQASKIDTGPIITHKAPLDGIGAAIERVLQREDEVVKTVITP
jgi:L-iditol 2-dehydrogenase